MATNYICEGKVLQYTSDGNTIKSGDLVVIGTIAGIAHTNIDDGETGSVHIHGVYNVPKANDAIDLGAKLYWDAKKSVLTTTSTSNTLVGIAYSAAAEADTHVQLLLNKGI